MTHTPQIITGLYAHDVAKIEAEARPTIGAPLKLLVVNSAGRRIIDLTLFTDDVVLTNALSDAINGVFEARAAVKIAAE